ncbi:hypothetical protein DSO57_1027278 [Entomophthora muscae]|uniref:Uncharacterized protein n=1 Tax=Entomophthora muscae TaxID=34485 RepID=A0ACC2TCX7_9FUNG|nr:hypothetical protein DSO57_1027278 [Entomophthora muscae]
MCQQPNQLQCRKAQNVEAPVYTQAFEAGNKKADLYLIPDPYGFELFNSHFVSSSALAPIPTPTQAASQPTNQDGNLDSEQLLATSQPASLQGNCGKFDSLALDTLSSTRESSAAYVNLLGFETKNQV